MEQMKLYRLYNMGMWLQSYKVISYLVKYTIKQSITCIDNNYNAFKLL